jgi:hypothetical protein
MFVGFYQSQLGAIDTNLQLKVIFCVGNKDKVHKYRISRGRHRIVCTGNIFAWFLEAKLRV